MPYPITSETGNLAIDPTVASGDLKYLLGTALRITTDIATINLESGDVDITQASTGGVNMMERMQGLRSGTVDFAGIFPKTTPPLGITSSVTFGNGYVQYIDGWSLDITWPEIDITSTAGAANTWRKWMPGGTGSWSGSYTCKASSGTAPVVPSSATTGAYGSATFVLADAGASDPTLTGNIGIPRMSQSVKIGDASRITYNFQGSGDLTQSNAGLTAASGAITKPNWDLDSNGTADNTVVLTVCNSPAKTYTFPAFWTRLSLAWKIDDVVRFTGTLRIADTVTVA